MLIVGFLFFKGKLALCAKEKKLRKLSFLGALIPLTLLPKYAHAMITIVVSATVELNFGRIAVDGAGTVTINTANGRTVSGGVVPVTGAGLESSGVLSISGSTGVMIDLSMTATAFNVDNGGGDSMVVNNFNLVTNGGGPSETVTLTSNPTTFPFGARLNVGAGQAAGTYTGTFSVSANYQ